MVTWLLFWYNEKLEKRDANNWRHRVHRSTIHSVPQVYVFGMKEESHYDTITPLHQFTIIHDDGWKQFLYFYFSHFQLNGGT